MFVRFFEYYLKSLSELYIETIYLQENANNSVQKYQKPTVVVTFKKMKHQISFVLW